MSALISLGVLAVISITVIMTNVNSAGLYQRNAVATKLNGNVLGLKASDMRLLQVTRQLPRFRELTLSE